MVIIRGATTAERDGKEEITESVKLLLSEIFIANQLKKEDVRGILFSLTADIHSCHPAKAARECGYEQIPLFACTEPQIEGGLPLCIRVMLFAEGEYAPERVKHVYQKGAKVLRKDISGIYSIALDGPAGGGKSTVAEILAKDYKILHLDTGAMYRACGLYALRQGIDPADRAEAEKMIEKLNVRVEYIDGTQHTFLGEEDVSDAIRRDEVSMAASRISAHPCVREKMVEMQREIAGRMSCVLDGRDIGTVVLPKADFKFFVTADCKVRAMRRWKELQRRGDKADFETIYREIEERDKQDTERESSPLECAPDAVTVDTSEMSIEEAVATVKSFIQKKI